jgi:hypothetical protein
MARGAFLGFLAATVLSLGYILNEAEAVLSPIIERQQESLRAFLGDARDSAKEWSLAANAAGTSTPSEPEDPASVSTTSDRVLPEVVITATGPHSFLTVGPLNQPMRFDPCRPVFWTVNPDNEPQGGRELLVEAFNTISNYTGLSFQYVGETTEVWSPMRDIRNEVHEGVGDWKPVSVWWLEDPQLKAAYTLLDSSANLENIAGFAGPEVMPYGSQDNRFVSVTGGIVMNATVSRDLISAGMISEVTWILWHEIGHLVGLDHVQESGQLMHSENGGYQPEPSPGDIQGLAMAGAGPCLGTEYPTKENYVPYYTSPSVVYFGGDDAH